MNRELKFRVWDKTALKYRDFNEVLQNNEYANPEKDNVFNDYCSFVVEQFTGLKDSKGKEIYEGDILRGMTYDYVEDKPVEKWINVFCYYDTSIARFVLKLRGESTCWDFHEGMTKGLDIIGNIHENPEPLDKSRN